MKKIYIVAGGTGGHINAALAMGEAFKDEYEIKYASGKRHLDYQLFSHVDVSHFDARPFTSRIFKLIEALYLNIIVFLKMVTVFKKEKPDFVIGCGGYVCGPILLAARRNGIPIFIIEQNAVAGITNQLLTFFSALIFANFHNTQGFEKCKNKVIVSGNPIRKNIKRSENIIGERLNIFVFGGSLGAKQINDAVEILLKKAPFTKLSIIHQVGKGNCYKFNDIHPQIEYIQKEYVDNMNEMYDWCNIIICRSGASSISELRIVRKPCILVPFPLATHNHQYLNALELEKEGGFFVKVLDQKLKEKELANEMGKSIELIYSKKKFYGSDFESVDSSLLIKKEILNYVRNK